MVQNLFKSPEITTSASNEVTNLNKTYENKTDIKRIWLNYIGLLFIYESTNFIYEIFLVLFFFMAELFDRQKQWL